MAGLLVEMHVLGVFWGDCSLSNTLFKRDDGALRAYLVDAETALNWSEKLPPQKRFEDLNIMEDNVDGELADYYSMNVLSDGIPLSDIASSIRIRYQRLWDTLTQDVVLPPEERFRLQERIRNLNQLGYSIGEIRVDSQESGDKVHFKIIVTGKNFHRHRLFGMTGIDAEEMQARKIMNEIQEIKAMLSWEHNRSTPLSVAAHYWYEQIYLPTIKRLQTQSDSQLSPCELYCQVLEHKWYLSEKAKRDVGRQVAVEDYYTNVLKEKEIKMSENFFDVAERRRSIRSFVSSPVEEEMIQKILEAANRAPSAGNMQAYEVYIIRDQAQKLALARASLDQDFLASASIVLVFCSHPARSKERYGSRGVELYCLQDATIACTFAMLAATAIGLGTVWIGAFNDEAVWKVIGSPEGQIPVVILPIGYPAENPAPRSRRKIDDLIHEL
jgi:nitroreductase